MSKPTVLLVEDEESLGFLIKENLETRDFKVLYAPNGREAYDVYLENDPDILVLDVMMPIMDGYTLAKKIRVTDHRTPIIFLTSKSQTKDVLEGFSHGGNDYIKKPFSMEELIVRMQSLLSRVQIHKEEEQIQIGKYSFNKTTQVLSFKDQKQTLTHKETMLLFHLSEKRNQVLDRSETLLKLWGTDDFFNARSMDVFITKLRKKLKMDPDIQIINIRGCGYKLIC
ncbi:response regulator transcription factor [bacterium SCSIO 12643]|nr:response regulator transcription factor [bacterium SCSIO 12643]